MAVAPGRDAGARRRGGRLRLRRQLRAASRWFAAAQIARLQPATATSTSASAPPTTDARARPRARRARRPPLPRRRPTASSPALPLDAAAHRGRLPAPRAARGLRRRLPPAALSRRRRLRAGRRLRGAARTSTSAPHPVAAVRDNIAVAHAAAAGRSSSAASGLPAAPYFNSGVLLIDVAAFADAARARALPRRSAAPHRRALIRHDQSLLNVDAARRLGRALAALELAVHLGVAAVRGDGGRATSCTSSARRKPWNHDRRRAAAALPPRLPRLHGRRTSPKPAGRPGRHARRTANRDVPAARCSPSTCVAVGTDLAAYLDRFPDDLTVIR